MADEEEAGVADVVEDLRDVADIAAAFADEVEVVFADVVVVEAGIIRIINESKAYFLALEQTKR